MKNFNNSFTDDKVNYQESLFNIEFNKYYNNFSTTNITNITNLNSQQDQNPISKTFLDTLSTRILFPEDIELDNKFDNDNRDVSAISDVSKLDIKTPFLPIPCKPSQTNSSDCDIISIGDIAKPIPIKPKYSRSDIMKQKKNKAKRLIQEKKERKTTQSKNPFTKQNPTCFNNHNDDGQINKSSGNLQISINKDNTGNTHIDLQINKYQTYNELRMLKNRITAQKSRDKKKDELDNLKRQNELLIEENRKLNEELSFKAKQLEIMSEKLLERNNDESNNNHNFNSNNNFDLFKYPEANLNSSNSVDNIMEDNIFSSGMSSPTKCFLYTGFLVIACIVCSTCISEVYFALRSGDINTPNYYSNNNNQGIQNNKNNQFINPDFPINNGMGKNDNEIHNGLAPIDLDKGSHIPNTLVNPSSTSTISNPSITSQEKVPQSIQPQKSSSGSYIRTIIITLISFYLIIYV